MLELVVRVAVARRSVRQVEVGLDRIALEMELVAALDCAEAVQTVPVIVKLDRLFLPRDDLSGLVLAPHREQGLGPADPRV